LGLNDVFKGLTTGFNERNVDKVRESLFTKRRSWPFVDQIDRLCDLDFQFLDLSGLLLSYFLLWLFNLILLLFRDILEVAFEVIGVDIFLLIEFHDLIIVEIDVLLALETQFGEEELLVPLDCEIRLYIVLPLDFDYSVLDEALHAKQ
jgi:hypothetical protein